MPARKGVQRESDRTIIARRYLAGANQFEIATELGVNQSTVSRELQVIQEEWRDRYAADWHELKARELVKIDELERVAWDAWERSKAPLTEREQVVKTDEKGKPMPVELSTNTTERIGDTRYLDKVQWCIEQRCKILGIMQVSPTMNVFQATAYIDPTRRQTVEAIIADPEAGRLAEEFMRRLASAE